MNKYLKKPTIAVLSLTLALLVGASPAIAKNENSPEKLKAEAQSIEKNKKRLAFNDALEEFATAETLAPYFENAYGLALIPTVGKAGFGLGGAHGRGYVFEQGKLTGEVGMTQVTVGLQWGGQAYSQLIFFEDKDAYEMFTSGNFEFGAQASAVAIKAGASAQTSTGGGGSASAGKSQSQSTYDGGMAIFTMAKGGLMYEASLGGQKFKFHPNKD